MVLMRCWAVHLVSSIGISSGIWQCLGIEGGLTGDSIAACRWDIQFPASVVFGSRGDVECINGTGSEGYLCFWWDEDGCAGAY